MNEIITQESLKTQINSLLKSDNIWNIISTRATEEKLMEFKSLTEKDLKNIAEFMPEINRATNSFGRRQSQFMDFVMTVSAHTDYRNLRQLLAEIENKRTAIKENQFKLKKQIVNLAILKKEFETTIFADELNKLQKQLEIEEAEAGIIDSRLYIEGALKAIYEMEEAYKEIMKEHNVPEKWDEQDFEDEEKKYHILQSVDQSFRDVVQTGRIGLGNQEYVIQLGINPVQLTTDIILFIKEIENSMMRNNNERISHNVFLNFLDRMYDKYKDGVEEAMVAKGMNAKAFYSQGIFKDRNK